jgi:hypothetical protein
MRIKGQGFLVSRFSAGDNVRYPVTAGGHLASNEAAMAPEPDDFRAHDGGWPSLQQGFEPRNTFSKRGRGHVRFVATCAKPAERFTFPEVRNPPPGQLSLQVVAVELWVSSGHRVMPNVDQLRDAVVLQQID